MSNLGEVWAATFREEERKPKMTKRPTIMKPTQNEVSQWGRMIASYDGAYGTADLLTDPHRTAFGLDGHLWMRHPVEEGNVREIWQNNTGYNDSLVSEFAKLHEYRDFSVSLSAYKARKKVYHMPFWACLFKFHLDNKEIACGWINAEEIVNIFDKYDVWREKKYPLRSSIEEL